MPDGSPADKREFLLTVCPLQIRQRWSNIVLVRGPVAGPDPRFRRSVAMSENEQKWWGKLNLEPMAKVDLIRPDGRTGLPPVGKSKWNAMELSGTVVKFWGRRNRLAVLMAQGDRLKRPPIRPGSVLELAKLPRL